jgi:hypothetical protein
VIRALSLFALLLAMLPAAAAAAPACDFKLGFKALHDQIPDAVGGCLENESHNTRNGNTEQRTTAHHGKGGLLVWRKADNWTAFTDGHWTWVNGPFGVQRRLNAGPLFGWEAPAAAQESAPPVVAPPGTEPAAEAPAGVQWARHDDPEKSFEYPAGWTPITIGNLNMYVSPDRQARVTYLAPFKMGRDAKAVDFLGRVIDQIAADDAFELGPHSAVTINGFTGDLQVYAVKSRTPFLGAIVAIQRGSYVHVLDVGSTARSWEKHEDVLTHILTSYVPKQQ